jgi:hypothetical protein
MSNMPVQVKPRYDDIDGQLKPQLIAQSGSLVALAVRNSLLRYCLNYYATKTFTDARKWVTNQTAQLLASGTETPYLLDEDLVDWIQQDVRLFRGRTEQHISIAVCESIDMRKMLQGAQAKAARRIVKADERAFEHNAKILYSTHFEKIRMNLHWMNKDVVESEDTGIGLECSYPRLWPCGCGYTSYVLDEDVWDLQWREQDWGEARNSE